MHTIKYFTELFESVEEYKKIVLLTFLIKIDKDLLREIPFSEYDISSLYLECKSFLIEQHEEYLDYVKNEEESIVERFLNR